MGNLDLSVEVHCGFVVLQHILLETLGELWDLAFKGVKKGFLLF
jgi:hypothetical protein